MKRTTSQIASTIDHAILHPADGRKALINGCKIAMKYNVASVCVKPYMIEEAGRHLHYSKVGISSVIGFPHGGNTTDIKKEECRYAIEKGATELDMVTNIAKVLDKEWNYVRDEIGAILELCRKDNVLLKVIFENDFLNDTLIIELCELCSTLKVDFIKTSTGFGFVKTVNETYNYNGATSHHVQLMKLHSFNDVKIKASGKIRNAKDLIEMLNAGAVRIGTSSTEMIMTELLNQKEKI